MSCKRSENKWKAGRAAKAQRLARPGALLVPGFLQTRAHTQGKDDEKSMITNENIETVLPMMGFQKIGDAFYERRFEEPDCAVRVDLKAKRIQYPAELSIERETILNFSKPENFVVLNCVCRLLEKGYTPECIVLEQGGVGGHGLSTAYLDILVKDKNGDPYLLIECKTPGAEFKRAWDKTLLDGGQLFNYFNSFLKAQFLCLYTVEEKEDKLIDQTRLITLKDNENFLRSNKKLKGFKDLQHATKYDYFDIWKNTYEKDFSEQGVFEQDVPVYDLGKKKFTNNDLKDVDNDVIQTKYHEFATILRKYNVSGRENAFDKLVNLFLAKIVDETQHPEELDFYWRGAAYDDYFHFQDRLQRMYKDGMQKFLNEDVTYIDEKTIRDAFKLFKNDPDATRDKVLDYFRQLKFFTNNDLTFLDVHNEQLFVQNAVILKEVVRMLQNIKLKTEEQNQFLGDLFEGFLDQGIKQSEGQYFTPLPIVRFIVSSLPLEKIVQENEKPPQMIDYACGAGHFLNEYANQIKPKIQSYKRGATKEYYAAITGIEKEYRLSKVSKVSAFMYGMDDIQIIYGDALANNPKVKDGSYSVLISNPPYSVKGFLETLSREEREQYELFGKELDLAKNNSIETFFVERAKQLLKPGGVAAIILPSSVLSNGNIYIRCREIIFKYFDVIAIAEFGGSTFGKTGTNTATLFLRRKGNTPEMAEHAKNRVACWFRGDHTKDGVFEDRDFIDSYCRHIGIDATDYETLLQGRPSDKLMREGIFQEYRSAFAARTAAKKIKKKRITAKYTEADREAEFETYILNSIIDIEKEKLYYYLLASDNPQPVLVSKSPTNNGAMKAFLGYEWSGAKGNEGIKYLGQAANDDDNAITKNKGIAQIRTPLFDPANLENEEKINTLIRKNFCGEGIAIPNTLTEFAAWYRLVDLIDFSHTAFDKALHTVASKTVEIKSKYDVVKLEEFPTEILKGNALTKKQTTEGNYKVVAGGLDFAYTHGEYNREESTITVSASGANAGYVNFWKEKIFASDCTTIRANSTLETIYVYQYLKSIQNQIFSLARGAAQPHVYPDDMKSLPIPRPPLEIQRQIVAACEKAEEAYNKIRMDAQECRKKIEELFEELAANQSQRYRLDHVAEFNPSKSALSSLDDNLLVSFVDMASVSNDGHITQKVDRILKDVKAGSYTYFAENDIIIAKITPCMENGKCAIATGLTNGIAMGSSEFHVVRCHGEVLPAYVFGFLNRDSVRKAAAQNMTGASGHRRVPVSFYENLEIPFMPLSEQRALIAKVEALERQILASEQKLKSLEGSREEVLHKYLNE